MSRLSSDGSLPVVNWKQLAATTSGVADTVTPLSATQVFAERILIRAVATNSDPVSFGADASADYRTLAAGQEYQLAGQPETRFDLNQIFIKSAGTSQALELLYQ